MLLNIFELNHIKSKMKRITQLWLVAFVILCGKLVAQKNQHLEMELTYSQLATAEVLLQIERIGEAQKVLSKIRPQSVDLEYRFLRSMADQSHLIVDTLQSIIQALAFHPESGKLAIAGSNKIIYLYNVNDWSLIASMEGHTGTITSLDFDMEGKWLVSGSRDKSVKLWDVSTGLMLKTNQIDFSQGIYQVKFTPNGDQIGVVSWELVPEYGVSGFFLLLDTDGLNKVFKQATDQHPAAGIEFHPSLPICIVSTWGELVYAYSMNDFSLMWKYDLSDPGEYNAFYAIDLNKDGSIVAVGSADHRVHLLESSTGKLLGVLENNKSFSRPIKTLDFHDDGVKLAVSGEDGIVRIWDIQRKELIEKYEGHTSTVNAIKWINEKNLISASLDTTIRFWDTNKAFVKTQDICGFGPWQIPVWQEKGWLVAPCSDEKLAVYDMATGDEIALLGKQKGLCGAITKAGKLATADFNGVVSIWSLETQKLIAHCHGHKARVDGVTWLKDGRLVSVGDKSLRVWGENGQQLDSILLNFTPFRVTSFGTFLAVSNNRQIVLYHTEGLKELKRIDVNSGSIQEMIFSPKGNFLCVFAGKNIEVFDSKDWTLWTTLVGHELFGYGLDVSDDEKYLLSGSYDQTMRLWDLKTGTNTLTYHGINKGVYGCKFVGRNRILASTGEGKIYRFYFE